MKSVLMEKQPAQLEGSVVRDGIRSYLKNYGLLVQRLKLAVEDESTNLPEDDLNRYISRLVDPLAFRAGHEGVVKSIESQSLFGEEEFEQVRIKSITEQAGSHGGLLRSGSNAKVRTLAGVGADAGKLDGPTITFPPNEWLDARIDLTDWHDEFSELYGNPQDGDVFEFYILPSDEGWFEVGFSFERE